MVDSNLYEESAIGSKIVLSENNETEDLERFAYKEYTIVGMAQSSAYIQFERGTTSLGTSKYASADSTMTVFVIFNPAKKPTPSATIAKIARYRPKLCLISRNVVFPIMDLIKKPPFSLADLPLRPVGCRRGLM